MRELTAAWMTCPRCGCPDIRPVRTTVCVRQDAERMEEITVHDDLSVDRQARLEPSAHDHTQVEFECPQCGEGIYLRIVIPPAGAIHVLRMHVCSAADEDDMDGAPPIDLDGDDDDWWSR